MRAGIVHRGTDFVLSDLDFWSTSVEEFAQTGSGMYGFSVIDRTAIEERVKAGEITNVSCASAHAPLGLVVWRGWPVAEERKEGRKKTVKDSEAGSFTPTMEGGRQRALTSPG